MCSAIFLLLLRSLALPDCLPDAGLATKEKCSVMAYMVKAEFWGGEANKRTNLPSHVTLCASIAQWLGRADAYTYTVWEGALIYKS